LDGDGVLFVVDRIKDMIVSGGGKFLKKDLRAVYGEDRDRNVG
jgi:acyl-CoA synthetase (AMP-forming)/AMP-acid ligase II